MGSPIFDEMSERFGMTPSEDQPALTQIAWVPDEPEATTANEQDHTNPWQYAKGSAAAPVNP